MAKLMQNIKRGLTAIGTAAEHFTNYLLPKLLEKTGMDQTPARTTAQVIGWILGLSVLATAGQAAGDILLATAGMLGAAPALATVALAAEITIGLGLAAGLGAACLGLSGAVLKGFGYALPWEGKNKQARCDIPFGAHLEDSGLRVEKILVVDFNGLAHAIKPALKTPAASASPATGRPRR